MPTFAFTVGSLGDFIALGDLIVKIGLALYRPGEYTKDYQELLRELEHFSQVLNKINICKGQKRTQMAEICFQGVRTQVDLTTRFITEFLNQREQASNSPWNNIKWANNGAQEMTELRRTLSDHRQMLSVLLEILLSQQLSDVLVVCEENVKDIRTIMAQRPKQLTLIDVIGNYREIPFDFCVSYELFTDVLRAYYKHQELPGHAFVARGDYQIVLGDNHRVVEAPEWTKTIRPDSTVAMSMILRRRGNTAIKCPRCGVAPKGNGVDGWVDCSGCPGRFQTTVKEEEELVSPSINASMDSPSNEQDPNHHDPQGSIPESRASEGKHDRMDMVWEKFRLLSIISLVECISNSTSFEVKRANELSRFRPEAQQYLLGLFLTRNFRSQNLKELDEASNFFEACSNMGLSDAYMYIRYRCALPSMDGSSACGAPFDRRDRFADHLHQHLDMKPYQCRCNTPPCIPPQRFATHPLLDHHTHEKRTICQYCQKSHFLRNIARHQRTCPFAREAAKSPSTV
ncbi:hypothetical protein CPB86DRAFT_790270 [Serendipita vermifera]|nr:hypothetical protein CPB86DRAFT_790270 [Serendipita vermifera]